jgi:predicted secreted protein
MPTPALSSFSTFLKRGDGGAPENFTLIAEVGDIAGPSMKANTDDATSHSSFGGFQEQIPTTLAVGDIKFPVNFVPSNATHSYSAGLIKDWYNKTLRNFQIVFPDSTTWAFSAYVIGVDMKAPVKGTLTADITLSVTGAPTLA